MLQYVESTALGAFNQACLTCLQNDNVYIIKYKSKYYVETEKVIAKDNTLCMTIHKQMITIIDKGFYNTLTTYNHEENI